MHHEVQEAGDICLENMRFGIRGVATSPGIRG
jgi:hypothetical protein